MDTATITGLRVSDAFDMPGADETVVAHARLEQRYPIHVTRDAQDTRARLAELLHDAATVAVVSDDTVDALYGGPLRRDLRGLGLDVIWHSARPGRRASRSSTPSSCGTGSPAAGSAGATS